MKRRAISKTKRFAILKRDHFRCQYCGAQGPHAQLQVDHIEPVALGGENEQWNLLTACRECNAGKRHYQIDPWWVAGKQNLLASGDPSFHPYDEIVACEKADYASFSAPSSVTRPYLQ